MPDETRDIRWTANIRKGPNMAYDSRCYDLAEHFLSDEADQSEERKRALAQHIQDAAEGFLS